MTTPKLSRLASPSIHIRTFPSPRNLSESKLVLSALQKFGEVVTFRNLKYDTTNTSTKRHRDTIAIYESAESAHRALAASPLHVPLSEPPHDAPSPSKEAHIVCEIQPSRHNHPSAMRRSPFHGAFVVDKRDARFADLVRSGVPVKALADFSMVGKRPVSEKMSARLLRENERLGARSLTGLYAEGWELEKKKKGQDKDTIEEGGGGG